MKILYAALRNDPRDIDRSSSVDYGFYTAFQERGHQVMVVGPFPPRLPWWEKGIKKVHDRLTGKRYLKWDFASVWAASQAVNKAVAATWPDVVFTMFPATLAFYRGAAPAVFNTDLTFASWQANGAGFSPIALRLLTWIEHQALTRSAQVVLHSEWSRQDVMQRHGLPAGKLNVLPMPSALPLDAVPERIDVRAGKALPDPAQGEPLRLLLVGKEYHRKGIDIATEVVAMLNQQGLPAELTVCASIGPPAPHVRYVGPFRKSVPAELASYMALYRQAHLLIHPARFEPAGIVPGEAAAFATPTVTNAAGALATTVKDGVSGIVLPKDSPAGAYVQAIRQLVQDPARYYELCATTRRRYEEELNWRAAGRQLDAILARAGGPTSA